MGCIVNGPGEMADADFGYVGGAPGKIDLYVGKVLQLSCFGTFINSIGVSLKFIYVYMCICVYVCVYKYSTNSTSVCC